MGIVRREVRDSYLRRYPEEEELIQPFLAGFDVTWARRRRAFNTELSVYFLKPGLSMTEAYGFSQEVLLVYAPYPRMQARTIQAAESFLHDDPGRGRVEKLNYFVISEDDDVEDWIRSYTSVNQESKIIVGFCAEEIRENSDSKWFVRNALNRQLYTRDLFDYRLPLQEDTYFFGRTDIIASFWDAIGRSENRGLFGLRKTGKTSLLYKLERIVNSERTATFLFYDCKLPSIRKLRWFELLARICRDLSEQPGISIKGKLDEIHIADTFAQLVSRMPRRTAIVLDEIEFVSPLAVQDPHWKQDFVDFWQTFWACQSRHRKICAVIAGVNPSAVETDIIAGVQNPLFGIVSYGYLTGLGEHEVGLMINTLGSRMGMHFTPDAVSYIHDRYGGHPLLTRIACSLINNGVEASNEARPVHITEQRLLAEEELRDSDLMFYCRHVVSELRQFYPDEYTMLEFLSSGQTTDFVEFAAFPEYTKHLESYGLLDYDEYGIPRISIPVVGRYVGLELARQEGRKTIYKVVKSDQRDEWIQRRATSIIHDMRFLEKLIRESRMPSLFGPNSFPEADCFSTVRPCETEEDFNSFINTANRCFVESIENYGQSAGKPKYFWKDIAKNYPGLWYALQRVKIYRHNHMHLKLNSRTNEALLEYLEVDLEGRIPSQVDDVYFVLQQCVLDGMLTGIQIEISSLRA